ncbi:hypothetical protein GO805_12825 [Staphylococcus aureus]|nr:hypothetical protein [Staphylococcus aureus]HDH6438645.1 hypothetical protein [Staphylococcus aureus MRSA-Lux-28]MVJ15619.1 hypothetical protein [Staphylococcus aureus]HCX2122095.1 hypothetical protein [Staphylococcus aureus]HCX2122769.1 hypothetical protein [Staphylococcus aureus]
MKKSEQIFRIKPKFKKLIKITSAEMDLTNSDLVNLIVKSVKPSELNIKIYKNKSKLNYDNVQASYMLQASNKKKIEQIASKHDIKKSQVVNLFFSKYFNEPLD